MWAAYDFQIGFMPYSISLTSNFISEAGHPMTDQWAQGSPMTYKSQWNVHLKLLNSSVELIGARSIQWILETSTDPEMMTTAAMMVLEVEWVGQDITGVLNRLTSHLHACIDSTGQHLPFTQARAVACLKAIYHMS